MLTSSNVAPEFTCFAVYTLEADLPATVRVFSTEEELEAHDALEALTAAGRVVTMRTLTGEDAWHVVTTYEAALEARFDHPRVLALSETPAGRAFIAGIEGLRTFLSA